MIIPSETDAISHGIQLAIAPVFLLTAVASMIGVVAHRLARIIDRARTVESSFKTLAEGRETDAAWHELRELRTRGWLANTSIGLLTLCSLLIGATIMTLFLGETIDLPVLRISVISFIIGLLCFLAALGFFFAETMIATRLLNFGKQHQKKLHLL